MKLFLTLMFALAPLISFASSDKGNGGDPNEIQFKEIAINIKGWLQSGNFEQLKLPIGVTHASYQSKMLDSINDFHIRFTDKPVEVRGVEKTCRNWIGAAASKQIECNSVRFAQADTELKYQLVHHELSGLAGLEADLANESQYPISMQISAYLREERVLRLPVVFLQAHAKPAPWNAEVQKEISGSCESLNISAIHLSFFHAFQHDILGSLENATGLKVRSYEPIFKVVSSTNAKPWKIQRAQVRGLIVMEDGTQLGLRTVSAYTKSDYSVEEMNRLVNGKHVAKIGNYPTNVFDLAFASSPERAEDGSKLAKRTCIVKTGFSSIQVFNPVTGASVALWKRGGWTPMY